MTSMKKFAKGEVVLARSAWRTVDIAMVAKAGGYDALYVDMQHAPYSIETTSTICAASIAMGITPLVRVPARDNGQWMARVLDGGAMGVIVPDVGTAKHAEEVVKACRFPPLGGRSVMGLGPALGYQAVPLAELNPRLNAETAVIVMLQNRERHRERRGRLAARSTGSTSARATSPPITAFPARSISAATVPPMTRSLRRAKHGRILGVGGIRHNASSCKANWCNWAPAS